MNILSNYLYKTISSKNEFSIHVENINSGWIDMFIYTPQKSFSYSASFISDAIGDLLNKTLLLFTKQPIHIRGDMYWNNNAIVQFDLEGETVIWFIQYSNELLTLLILEDIDSEILEDFYSFNFNVETYQSNLFKSPPDLSKQLKFAIQVIPELFAQLLIKMFTEIENICTHEEYGAMWGEPFPIENLKKLQDWIKVSQCQIKP